MSLFSLKFVHWNALSNENLQLCVCVCVCAQLSSEPLGYLYALHDPCRVWPFTLGNPSIGLSVITIVSHDFLLPDWHILVYPWPLPHCHWTFVSLCMAHAHSVVTFTKKSVTIHLVWIQSVYSQKQRTKWEMAQQVPQKKRGVCQTIIQWTQLAMEFWKFKQVNFSLAELNIFNIILCNVSSPLIF